MTLPRSLCCLLLLASATVARADLPSDIKDVLRDKYLSKVQFSIAVAQVGAATSDDKIVYQLDADRPLIPASNLKLLTTSAFLDHFGGDFKFRTVLLVKDNDLYLIGDGDPTLGDVELLKKLGWDATTTFKNWAEQLKQKGITSVRNVIVDDNVFDESFIHPHWLARYAHQRYSAQIGGVNFNANCVDFWITPAAAGQPVRYTLVPDTRYVSVRNECMSGGNDNVVGVARQPGKNDLILHGQLRISPGEPISVTIHDPPMFAATVLRETLAANGIAVSGAVSRDRNVHERFAVDQNGWTVAAALQTQLSTVLNRANKDSMNLYAECLCKRLGHAVANAPGSWENGTAAVGEFLHRIGVSDSQFHLDDGCGLSRENNVCAEALVKVLAYNFHGPNREIFQNSLAVPGEEGTFKRRFAGELKSRVWGKSGYVSGVSAISGYLKGRDDRWYAYSILMNNVPEGTNNDAKKVQERILSAVDANLSHHE